ncbi:MAG: hypothetical protein V4596_10445 [Bdellovibrionota bacterium]
MSFIKKSNKKFFCAFCKSPRTMNMQKHVQLFEISISLAGSLLLMLVFFQGFDSKVLILFGILLSIFEFFVQLKFRLGMACSQCGFDPLLYMKSKDKACALVKTHLESRKNNPAVYMSSRPALDLPVITNRKDNLGRNKRVVVRSHVAKNLDLKM